MRARRSNRQYISPVFFFLVKAGTNDSRHINGEFRCEGGILSPIVRLGASWLETCTSIRLRNNRRLNVACVVEMFVQIGNGGNGGGGGIIRFSVSSEEV